MSAKNLLDNSSNGRPGVFSDLTGNVSYEPRVDLAAALVFLQESYVLMLATEPKVETFAVRFAVTQICYHMGWHPYEISAAEQYVAHAGVATDLVAG